MPGMGSRAAHPADFLRMKTIVQALGDLEANARRDPAARRGATQAPAPCMRKPLPSRIRPEAFPRFG